MDMRAAFRLWQSSQTQLRVAFGGPIGLDYVAVRIVAEAIGVEMDAETLEALQVLEAEFLDVWEEEQQKRKGEA